MIIKPFKIIKSIKWQFYTFILFTLIIGQLGLFLPIFQIILNQDDILKGLISFSETGLLYNTIIPLLGSSMYLIIKSTFSDTAAHFKSYKLFLIACSILSIIISSFLLSDLTNIITNTKLWLQVGIYTIGILIIVYSYLSLYLHMDMDNFKEQDDKIVSQIKNKSKNIKNDNRGIKI
ncbi:MAG: hypothetical protein OCD02_17215 [Spirochaetaceae bacterium]